MEKIVGAFQSWTNGGVQTSSLYLASRGDDVEGFVNDHYNSGTFASLETFTSEEEAKDNYNFIQDLNGRYGITVSVRHRGEGKGCVWTDWEERHFENEAELDSFLYDCRNDDFSVWDVRYGINLHLV